MFTYSMLQFYFQKQADYKRLAEQLKNLEPHRVISRKRGSKTYYCELYRDKGTIHEKRISRDDYFALGLQNYRYKTVRDELKECKRFLSLYKPLVSNYKRKIEKRFETLKKLALTDDVVQNTFYDDHLTYRTQRGEIVRSKTEVIIADLLFVNKINYEYESMFAVRGVRPDFYIEDNIRGIPVIWEHFGLLNNQTYLKEAMEKIDKYAENGYFINYNLIITYELYDSERNRVLFPFDSARGQQIVQEWFMPKEK